MKLNHILIGGSLISCLQISAQWQPGGNNLVPPFPVNTANNFIGTNASNNTWLRMGVQGSQDIFIDNNPGQLNGQQPLPGARPQGGHWVGLGRVFTPSLGPGANSTYSPKAHLHIHGGNNTTFTPFSTGMRSWFNTGTLYSEESDAMYVGLRTLGPNSTFAVINWSDDPSGSTDFLSFNFTGQSGLAGTNNGAEMARINSKIGGGTFGIGNFMNIGMLTEPVRRLEILDADPQTGANSNSPQLRITHTYNVTPTMGIFSEFQTTSNGDLYFNTRKGPTAAEARSFGFHKSNPLNTVEISAQNISPYDPLLAEGSSGLRFTSLTSANNTIANGVNGVNSNKILTVDGDGDVVLVNSGFGALCSVPADITATQLTASRAINLNNFNFEWRNGRVGFGTTSCVPGNRVEISGLAASQSGLRFTNMNSANAPVPNPGPGVLSVDANGDVIYVPGGSTITGSNGVSVASGVSGLGVDCSSPPAIKIANRLMTNRMIHLNGKNMIFADGGSVGIGMGLNNCSVGNKLEVTSGFGMPYFPVITTNGSSGLRLTNLTSLNTPLTNGTNGVDNNKVLSVDQNGDVVLVNALTGLVGNSCGGAVTNPLTSDWEIPLNGKNYIFSDPTTLNYGQNTVRIGAACNAPLFSAKLEVVRQVTNIPSTVHTLIGVGSINSDKFPTLVIGDKSYAGYFVSDGGSVSVPTNYSNYGVVGIAKDARTNYGGYFEARGPSTMGYGIYAKATSGMPGAGPLAGYFDGDVVINGPYSGYSNQVFSDKNIKTNVVGIKSSMDIINKLNPVSFNYDNSYAPQLRVDNQLTYGFIAQEVGNLLPTLTRTLTVPEDLDSLGNVINPTKTLTTLNYDGLIPFAISGLKELYAKQQDIITTIDKSGLSDAQVKTNVNTFNALAKIKTLQPVRYNFTNANVPQLTFNSHPDYGFIAQQLETVYPELVDTLRIKATVDSLGAVVNPSKLLKTVNYKAMSGILVRSIQEQQSTIDSLRTLISKQDSINQNVQKQMESLASLITGCCQANARTNSNADVTTLNQLDIELSDKDAIVLNQNVPNPFAEQTTIMYNVPASVGKAQIIFFNNLGQVIQTIDIKTRGKGKVNVFASDLSSGLYNYTLVADGKVIDTKKMVRE
jgi:hypothetical protein